jgi:glycosyltransferase involved in cell wall biosynthesis
MNRAILRRADRVLVFSASDRDACSTWRLADPSRVTVIRAAFELPRFADRDGARRAMSIPAGVVAVGWVGRLCLQKDPITFVRAMRGAERRDLLGLMAGDGPLKGDVIRACGGSGAVRLLGWVADPAQLLAAADLFVSTSKWEGMPLAALEAAARGLPLILTDVPGNRDLADAGTEAILVPAGDGDAVAAAIQQLADDPPLRARMGEAASAIARRTFTPEALAEDVLAVYRNLA